MGYTKFYYCCAAVLCLAVVSVSSEKQIKLEDIEKDTLKAAQQAKYEKQIQQQQVQVQVQQQQPQPQQQYQQITYQYDPQVYAQQNVAYQTPATYSQYLVPQQYIPQTVISGYSPLASNGLETGYGTPSAHTFQTYLSPQLTTIPSLSGYASQSLQAATQTQPLYINLAAPALTTFHQPSYYQGALQYYPAQTAQATQFYYTPQTTDQASATSTILYPPTQQYIPTYQTVGNAKAATSYNQQYVSTAPQTFPAQSFSTQQEYTSIYTPQTYSSNTVYTNTETPTFVTVKAPQHLVASQGQQQQYIQSHSTTMSPLQAKYLNSPQYLAANYNTIQSSHLYPKGPLSSGVKSTVSPPLKGPISLSTSSSSSSSYVPNSFGSGSSSFGSSSNSFGSPSNSYGSASSSVSSYQPFRSLPSKNY